MRRYDLTTGAARIRTALDELQIAWQESGNDWDDLTRKRFEELHLEPMVPQVKMALDAIGRMNSLLNQMQRDCEK